MALAEIAEALYAGVPEQFTAARTTAEKAARADGDRELAASIKGLKRPTVGAWAVNLLVRWEAEQIDQVFALAESLRQAAVTLDGTELRQLTRQRRQLTAALTTRARQLALEHGVRLTGAVAEQVEGTLTAAMLDEGVAEAVRTGLLVTTVSATGVERVELDGVVAFPEAIGSRAPAAAEAAKRLRVLPEQGTGRLDAARAELAEAEEALANSRERAAQEQQRLEETEGNRLRIQAELDELARRMADLEENLDLVDETLQEHQEASMEANAEVAAAEERRERAGAALAELEGP